MPLPMLCNSPHPELRDMLASGAALDRACPSFKYARHLSPQGHDGLQGQALLFTHH